ncbi:MAG: hypothetical protein JXB07_18835 [Anaerolineae bacterium]|nr:hypothetical protein [Anaerolineae bacterium]
MPAVSRNKVSFILGDTGKGVNMLLVSGARPPVVKIHNNISHAQAIHNKLGDDTEIIVRMTALEGIVTRTKKASACAVEWCEAMESCFKQAPYVSWEAGPPLQICDQWYNEFLVAAMNWAWARKYKLCVMTVGEGTPEVPSAGIDGWSVMLPTVQLAASYGYILGPQAYWIDGNMDINDDWHMFRIYRAFRDYPGKFPPGTRIMFSETGIDLRNGLGWRNALGKNWKRYRAGLKALSDELNRRSCPPGVSVLGATVFAIHEVDNEWRDFNYLDHLPDQLADIKAEQKEEEEHIIEVPPAPVTELPLNTVAVKTISRTGQNIRAHHSLIAPIVGGLDYGDVGYISIDEVDRLGVGKAWCYVKAPSGEGWMGAWLLDSA